jgi:glycosyltransferase involved in cell wall biosynthesis
MKRILQINASEIGGGFRVMQDIINGLDNDFDFLVVLPTDEPLKKDKKQEETKKSIKIKRIKQGNVITLVCQIKKIIQREKPEIIHAHGTRAAAWVRIAVAGMKEKPTVIYTLHGFHVVRKNFLSRWILVMIEKVLNRWADVLACVSDADKKLVLKYKVISKNKIRVIKNGIKIENFYFTHKEIEEKKEEMGISNKLVLSSIGRLHPQKDFLTLLRALRIFIKRFSGAKIILLIVGDGPLRGFLEKAAKELSIENYVSFLGFRKDVPRLMNASDVIILSTNWEGLPLVPLEAGASKKPIIASDVEGIRETIIDKKTGLLFKPGSSGDLAEKIIILYQSRELLERMGEENYKNVLRNFNLRLMLENYKSLYNEL